MEHRFDIVKCQRLYVSGADLIDNSSELTEITANAKLLADVSTADLTALASIDFPASVTIAVAAGSGSNECDVTFTVKDGSGTTLTGVRNLEVFFSDDADGIDLCSTLAIDSIAEDTGKILTALTANKHLIVQTASTGICTITITDAAQGAGYACVVNPVTGLVSTGTITTDDYTD